MHYLSEDPWPLVGILGFVALGFLIALKVTQQGKYLIRAGIALGLALAVLVVEQLWVTDNERVESAVIDLARALRESDGDAVAALMAPDVEVVLGSDDLGQLDVDLVRRELGQVHFELLKVMKLNAEAGSQTRRGKATFQLLVQGEYPGGVHPNFGGLTEWDLGFREVDGAWKVARVSPTRLPGPAYNALRMAMRARNALRRFGPGRRP